MARMVRWRSALAIALLLGLSATGCRSVSRSTVVRGTGESASPEVASPVPVRPQEPVWASIGRSRMQRPLEATTVGDGALRVYIIGGIHGNEPEGLAATNRLAGVVACDLSGITARILRDANPDGTAAGTRGNSRGVDLNRNWPAANFARASSRGEAPLSEPETRALEADLRAFGPHLVVVFHSIASGPFANFDGPAAGQAEAFADAAKRLDSRWKVVPQMGYRTPGSLGSYLGVDRGIAILTIEFRRGQDQESAALAAEAGIRAVVKQDPSLANAGEAVLRNGDARRR